MRLRLVNVSLGENDPFLLGVCSEYHNVLQILQFMIYGCFGDLPNAMQGGRMLVWCCCSVHGTDTYSCFTGLTSYQ